ncbi:MAG TPA: FTR1 family protein [Nitrosopumilaceae archaeon]|nr:FTR1 family protein [Nitrosopumilaceae archaeon]
MQSVLGQSQEQITLYSNKELTIICLELTEQNIAKGNYDPAIIYSKFASDAFARSLQVARSIDNTLADEIHITLVEIQADINSRVSSDTILQKISSVKSMLGQIKSDPLLITNALAQMLSVADEKYEEGTSKNIETSYQISHGIILRVEKIFSSADNFDERQHAELKSFFTELDPMISSREDFVKVGTLITAIQRDMLGTQSTVNQNNLYEVIRELYKQLLVEVNIGNYEKAEQLAIEAYLENFEYLEADIDIVDSSLLHKLEIAMREDLRNAIRQHSASDMIEQKIEAILVDLNIAENLVSTLPKADLTPSELAVYADKELAPMGSATDEQKSGVQSNIDFIRQSLQSLLIQYKEGDYQSAYTTARTAYLDSYEHVEIPLRAIDPNFTLEAEIQFAELRNLINKRADYEKVQEATVAIKRSLDESERLVSGTGTLAPAIAFSSSFALIFREGLESVLILGAILTYLEASRNTRFKPYVYYGVVAAIAATAVTWFIASYVIEISGANRELIEAIAALSATAVLFYVSFWILNKIETKKWMEFVKAKVWQASATGGFAVFVMLSFFTVYREGFETVLFYQAMFGFAKYMEAYVGLGFVLGIAVLFVVYYAMRKIGKRLPLKALFGLTMGVGAYLSIAFIGNAVRELQTLDIIPVTNMIGIIPRLDINLSTMTGIHPTLETTIAQIILLGVYLTAASYVLVMRPRKEEEIAKMRKSRAQIEEV